jgi:hypothetical protein
MTLEARSPAGFSIAGIARSATGSREPYARHLAGPLTGGGIFPDKERARLTNRIQGASEYCG